MKQNVLGREKEGRSKKEREEERGKRERKKGKEEGERKVGREKVVCEASFRRRLFQIAYVIWNICIHSERINSCWFGKFAIFNLRPV